MGSSSRQLDSFIRRTESCQADSLRRRYPTVGTLPDGSTFSIHWGPKPWPEDGITLTLVYKTQGGAFVRPTSRVEHRVTVRDAEYNEHVKTFTTPAQAYMISLGSPVHQVIKLGEV